MAITPQNYLLGKLPPKFDKRTLLFSNYVTPELPPPPLQIDYSQAVKHLSMLANNLVGDCVLVAIAHMIQLWTANVGSEREFTDEEIVNLFNQLSGGAGGLDMLLLLKYWRKQGILGDKCLSFLQLERGNHVQLMDAINLFGNAYIGLALPDCVVPKTGHFLDIPWVVPATGPIGDAAPNPINGHSINAVGYDQRNVYVNTWGAVKSMSWTFFCTYVDEIYVVLSNDWIDKKVGLAPSGFDLATLRKDLQRIAHVPDNQNNK